MLVIGVKDHENNRWKRNEEKKDKDRKQQGVTKAIVKWWEVNDFVVRLS